MIPQRGSVGASGDLVPLAYLADLLTGNGAALYRGELRTAADALREAGLTPIRLAPKEGLALINGTSFMAGWAVVAIRAAHELSAVADLCTALAAEALGASTGPFEPFLHRHKPHRGQYRSAARIRRLLHGSQMAVRHRDRVAANPELAGDAFQLLRSGLQDRYFVRCAPHVTGVLNDTLDWVADWLDTEINSSNDNPLFDPDTGEVRHGGNFYGGHVGQAMDAIKLALAGLGDLLDRQTALLVDEKSNNGLTANLIRQVAGSDPEAGLHHGFKAAQIASSALAAEALKNTMPATAFSRSTESHNQDKVSMATIAARDAWHTVDLVRNVAAVTLAAACQAADLRGSDRLAPATRAGYELVRTATGFMDRDRRLDTELAALATLIATGRLGALLTAADDRAADELPEQARRPGARGHA